ncbi:MAG: hypothetical protein IJ292_05145 [Clostridia bacterium]|nr:hypothetical protein [Clostridia bacterium]
MSNKEVTIVTAFFDIGRESFGSELSRSNEKYLNFFRFWARMKNKLVVYTFSAMAPKVEEIRREFGLEDRTKVVVVDNVFAIEAELHKKMTSISENQEFLKFRYMPNPADNNADYNYVMLMKSWFLMDAAEKKYADGMLCWMDFGFNHGGGVFTNAEEFDFTLSVDFPDDKITLFSISDYDDKPVFHIIQDYSVYIMGFLMYVPSEMAKNLWFDVKTAMESLVDVGFIDDDQTLYLMARNRHPENYNVIKSGWFMPLKEYGGEHLTIRKFNTAPSFKDRLLKNYRVFKRNRRCIRNLKSMFMKRDY